MENDSAEPMDFTPEDREDLREVAAFVRELKPLLEEVRPMVERMPEMMEEALKNPLVSGILGRFLK